jgi:hypothetical protein
MAQVRLDVEAALFKAGRKTIAPVDHDFFDPFELNEDSLRDDMCSLGLADEFDEIRKRAEARFPQVEDTEAWEAQPFVAQYKARNWSGMKGVFAHASLWLKAEKKLSATVFEQFAAASDLPAGCPSRAEIQRIAQRYARVQSFGLSEFSYWALFAVISLLDADQFDQLVSLAGDMGPLFANELVEFLEKEPLDARMKRKAVSGGHPSVAYEIKRLPSSD